MVLNELINIIESAVPRSWQEAWDNTGLQVGNSNAEIKKALLTVDVTPSVVQEAVFKNCDLILSHHPLLFHGLKHICGQTPQECMVEEAIRHHISIYSSHTAVDSYLHGVSGKMAEKLGLTAYHILVPSDEEHGLGMIGDLKQAINYQQLLEQIKRVFKADYIRYTKAGKETIQRIAICGGSGAEFIPEAIRQGADVYITADVKYHDFVDSEGKIAIVDIDHWVSEQFVREVFQDLLKNVIETEISTCDGSPVQVYSCK